ncbi:MAG: protein TolR [Betaproteobacteria bacterium]|jgi:biopolymer transport protein TolR|nr:MAG: protein TolR [Betaproteobacteria bacterium]
MAIRRRPRLVNQINVVPYIDVMLVLLVIFMVTAPMITPGTVNLPSVGNVNNPPAEPIEVQIAANGSISVIDHDLSGYARAVSRKELAEVIRAKQRDKPQQAVIITADKEIKYDLVLKTMDMLIQTGVENVGLLALPKT